MSTDLDRRLSDLGNHLDAERAHRESASSDVILLRSVDQQEIRRSQSQRHWALLFTGAAAIAILLVAVTGVLSRSSNQPFDVTVTGVATDTPRKAFGLFPTGDRSDVISAGFGTAEAVVSDYLADRIANIPEGFAITGSIGATRPTEPNKAVVEFSLMAAEDRGDGYILVERVSVTPDVWVVVSSAIIGLDLSDLSYINGIVAGNLGTSFGGSTLITVHDALTDQLLLSSEVQGDTVFELEAVEADAVAVRFWNVGDLSIQPGPGANFAEVRLSEGEEAISAGWPTVAEAASHSPAPAPSIDDATVSTG